MTDNKSASQLIEDRMQEMPAMYNDEMSYKYNCMDTGLMFETYGEGAAYSPYTGSPNIMMMESVSEEGFQKMTDLPSSQKDPMKQVPVSQNPVPPGAAPKAGPDAPWMNAPWAGNPAPDASGVVGASSADSQGFVTYPQQSVPPHVNKQPGERTDK